MRTILFVFALLLGVGAFAAATGVFESVDGLLGDAKAVARDLELPVGDLLAASGISPGADGPTSDSADAPAPSPDPEPSGTPSIYRYTDDAGNLQFVSSLSQVPAHLRDSARAAGKGTVSRADARSRPDRRAFAQPASRPSVRQGADVVVYSTKWCGYCRKTLAWLNARGIPYENRDIEEHDLYRQQLQRKTGRTAVPMVEINGRQIQGYNPAMLERLLVSG